MSTLPAPSFGGLLRRARRAAGLTQEQLAERAGLSVDLISKVEREVTRAPQQYTLDQLAEALQLSPEERAQWERAVLGKRLPGAGAVAFDPPELTGSNALSVGGQSAEQTTRHQFPAAPTALIGRQQEVQAVCTLMQRPQVRLLTLTGSAGVGKTRLAQQVAVDVVKAFADGVQFVSLAALSDPELVLPTITQTVGLHESHIQPILTQLTTHLHTQQVLLILDNFEQVMAAAPHLAALLAACPALKLLVTSREVLHLRAEQQFAVPPLALPVLPPRDKGRGLDLETLAQNPAVELFLQRAQAVQPEFHLTFANAPAIVEICRRLDGLPLALEMAAPRLKLLSPQALLERLEGRLQVLGGGARDLPERQRTMQATIAWSYELLSSDEQALFRRLSVFLNGWTLAAAEHVCPAAGVLELDVLEGLASLLDKSLVLQEQGSDGELRYRLLYVLREFGLERLEDGEEAATREAHATFYLALAEEVDRPLLTLVQKVWVDQQNQEHDNLRAALSWWLERAEQTGSLEAAERALRLCGALYSFWIRSLYLHEGRVFLERALALRTGVPPAVQLKVSLGAANLLLALDEVERGEALTQESLVLARQEGDLLSTADTLILLGGTAQDSDEYAVAREYYEAAAALIQQTRDARERDPSFIRLWYVLLIQGEYEQARALAEESLILFQRVEDTLSMSQALSVLGWTLFVSQREQARAVSLVEKGLALQREIGDVVSRTETLYDLGVIRRHQGRFEEARALMEEGLALGQGQWGPSEFFKKQTQLAHLLATQGDLAPAQTLYEELRGLLPAVRHKYLIASYLEGRAVLEAALDQPGTAARLWGAAEALRESIGAPMFPIDRAEYAPVIAAARTALGEVAFAAAWSEGRQLTPQQALAGVE